MAIDQVEDLRRRLEARQTGKPYVPPQPSTEPDRPPDPVKPVAPPVPDPVKPFAPETQALAQRRKLEAALANNANAQPVVIVDVKIKFWSMVVLMVKWAIAAIPAAIIIAILFSILFQVVKVLLSH